MKHLLSFVVICNIHLAAGLPRLYYIDSDSASILQKSDVKSQLSARISEGIGVKLTPRANPKDGSGKGSQPAIGHKAPSAVPLLPKQQPKTAPAINNKQTSTISEAQKKSKVGL